MNIIEQMWKKGRSRVEVGVIYQDGSYVPILGCSSIRYDLGEKISIEPLIQKEPDLWFYYSIVSRQLIGDRTVIAGGGSLEAWKLGRGRDCCAS